MVVCSGHDMQPLFTRTGSRLNRKNVFIVSLTAEESVDQPGLPVLIVASLNWEDVVPDRASVFGLARQVRQSRPASACYGVTTVYF